MNRDKPSGPHRQAQLAISASVCLIRRDQLAVQIGTDQPATAIRPDNPRRVSVTRVLVDTGRLLRSVPFELEELEKTAEKMRPSEPRF